MALPETGSQRCGTAARLSGNTIYDEIGVCQWGKSTRRGRDGFLLLTFPEFLFFCCRSLLPAKTDSSMAKSLSKSLRCSDHFGGVRGARRMYNSSSKFNPSKEVQNMSLSLKDLGNRLAQAEQTIVELTQHTHSYDRPSFSGEASYQSFLSFPTQYANLLLPFNDPNGSGGGFVQTGPPDYPSSSGG